MWGGAESRIHGQLKLHPFPGGILAEVISMTHSGMTHSVSTGYFYNLFL